jgi:hypothetical protein
MARSVVAADKNVRAPTSQSPNTTAQMGEWFNFILVTAFKQEPPTEKS